MRNITISLDQCQDDSIRGCIVGEDKLIVTLIKKYINLYILCLYHLQLSITANCKPKINKI